MKKLNLIMIIVWCIIGFAIIAAMIAGIFAQKRGGGFSSGFGSLDKSNMELRADETILADGIDNITLGLAADECYIYLTDSSDINVKHYAYNLPENVRATVKKSGGRLNVSTKANRSWSIGFFGFSNRSIVEIYLPKTYKSGLEADLSSGSIWIDDSIEVSDLKIKISSGSIRTDSNIKAEKASFRVTSGNLMLGEGLDAENYLLDVSSGKISIDKQLKGSGEVEVTSGSIYLGGVDITDSLSVKASSGTIRLGIADDAGLSFTGHKSSGSIRTYFDTTGGERDVTAEIGGEPRRKLDVRVTSGTIRIERD